uniref:Flagellar protein FliT n=1 Tax=Panagrellus redivivus TaxID=6233 RepID=A0A7E4W582_PANRE
MGAQPIYDITIAAVAAIKTTSALRRQLPLTVDTLKKNLDKAKRTSFNIEEFDPNQPDSNVILLRAQFDTRKNMEQLQVALNKLIQLDQQWQNLLMTATDKTEQTDETNKWSEKKYGTENATGYLQIIDDAD